jgi:hypothetical protein
MEELDLLKKDWKKSTNSFKQLSEMDIYKMIHKKSSSIVKWILVLSILEVAVWTALGFVFNSDDYLEKISNSSLELIFNYIRITTVASTKQLMKDILRTRKTVQYYVWYNLAMIAYGMMVGIIIAFTCSPEIELLREKTANSENNMIMVITFSVVLIAVTLIFGLFWLFYRLLYGTLLRRLYANYKELKKIDL